MCGVFHFPVVPFSLSLNMGQPIPPAVASSGPPAAALLASCSLARLLHNPLPCWFLQPPPCLQSSPFGCPSPPLLPVWMNVSSLTPWLSDFHTIRFSVSSGGFLFLNCCCPSYGCARRHSVPTYTSILAGSDVVPFFLFPLFPVP